MTRPACPVPAASRRKLRRAGALGAFAFAAALLAVLLFASASAPAGAKANDDRGPAVSAVLAIANGAAYEGSAITFSMRLDKAVPGGFTVTPSYTDYTATRGRDYTPNTTAIRFTGAAGETRTFTVATKADASAETNEVFTVGLTVSDTRHKVTVADTALGIIQSATMETFSAASAGASSGASVTSSGGNVTVKSPRDPVLGRQEYKCVIPKRVSESANSSLRFKHFQIACSPTPGAIRAGAVAEIWSAGYATATNGTSGNWDYNFFHTKVTFWPGSQGTKHLGFRINDDQLAEGPETYQFALKWSTKVGIGWGGIWVTLNESIDILTVTIDDDDEYNLTVSPAKVQEGDPDTTVTVTAALADNARLGEARKLNIQVGASTDRAIEGTDYKTVGDFDITIPKGSNSASKTFTLSVIDDALMEGAERITVSGRGATRINGANADLRPRVRSAGLDIWDNEKIVIPSPVVSNPELSSGSVHENGGEQTVTLTATGTSPAQRAIPLTITLGKSGDSAVKGTDYHAVAPFTLTIAQGSKSGTATFKVTPVNDTLIEADETITITGLAAGAGGATGGIPVAGSTLTILDNDVQLLVNPSSVGEEGGEKTVTVTARIKTARPSPSTLVVSVGKPGDAAVKGTDYGAVSDFTLTIPANSKTGTATFTFTPRDDKIIEGSESLTVHGGSPDVHGATLTLTETDTTDLVVRLSPDRLGEDAGDADVLAAISTTDGVAYAVALNCSLASQGGTAAWNQDYTLRTSDGELLSPTAGQQYLTVAKGETRSPDARLRVRVLDDSKVEGDETVTIGGHAMRGRGSGLHAGECSPTSRLDGVPEVIPVYQDVLTLVDDETSVRLAVTPSSVGEGAGATGVTVTASLAGGTKAPAGMPVTVTVGAKGDSATSGTDYRPVDAFVLTIAKGTSSASRTVTFTPTDDALVEGDETVSVSGTTPKTSVTGTALTIADDDKNALTLTAKPAAVSEGDGATTVTVTASTGGAKLATATDLFVAIGMAGDTATEGSDYTTVGHPTDQGGFVTGDLRISLPAGATGGTVTFTLEPVDDAVLEGGERIGVAGRAAGLAVTGTSVLIEDDEAEITLAASPATVAENGGARTVTVTATKVGGPAKKAIEVTVSPGKLGDTAVEGTDYSAVADFTFTINKGATKGSGTFTLTPVDDALYEGTESLTIGGTASSGGNSGFRVGKTSVEITDDDPEVKVSLSVKPKRVKECSGATTMTVTAALPSDVSSLSEARNITVSVGKTGDGATSGIDYDAVGDFTLTIPKGHHNGLANFTLTPLDDTDEEGDETLSVHATAARLKVGNEAQVTIEDDDRPIIVLTMDPAKIPENDKQTTVKVTASLWDGAKARCAAGNDPDTSARPGPAAMAGWSAKRIAESVLGRGARPQSAGKERKVTATVGDAGDTAVSGTDYTAVKDFTITIPAGKTSGTKTFTTKAKLDRLLELDETVTTKGVSTGYTVVPAGGYVEDGDEAAPTLTVNPLSVAESAGATTITVTVTTGGVTASHDSEIGIVVGAAADPAVEGTDYATVADFVLRLPTGDTSATGTFTLTPDADTLVEDDETIEVSVRSSTLSQDLTITDDDVPAMTLEASPSSVAENAGATTVTVTAKTGGVTFKADRTVTVKVGDSADGATSGTDYAAVSDFDVTITKGQTSGTGTFTLTPTDDSVVEGDETITVAGTTPDLTVTGTSVAITDDDSAELTVNNANEEEGDSLTFTVTLDNAVEGGLTVTPGYTNGTAGDADYTANRAALNFTGTLDETKTFTVKTTEDAVVEADETFTVGLTVSNAPAGVTATDTGTGTIGNDDNATVTIASASTAEGGSLSFTATLDKAVDGGLTATPGYTDATATKGTDYTANTTALSFTGTANETKTFTVQTTEDTTVEDEETFTVAPAISGLKTGVTGVTGVAGTGTITDDDGTFTLSATPSSVTEDGGKKTVTVTATSAHAYAAARTITVTVGKSGDTAVEGTDYAAVADFTLTLPANAKSGSATFELEPTDDTIIEGEERLAIGGTATGLTVSGTSVAIIDDDAGDIDLDVDVEPFLDANPDRVAENGGAKQVKVTAGTRPNDDGVRPVFPLDREVSVTVGDGVDSALEGTDYQDVAGFTVTIKAGQSEGSHTFTLTPTDDTLVEGDEEISVAGSASGLKVTKTEIRIVDDDAPSVALSLSPSSVAETAGPTTVTVTASTGGVTFNADRTIRVSVGAGSDSATSGDDYAAVDSFDLTIAKGKTSGTATFTFDPVADVDPEGDETVSVYGAATDITVSTSTLTLSDVVPAVVLSVEPPGVAESAGSTTATVTAATGGQVFERALTLTVSVGAEGDSATEGTDYAEVSDLVVTIAAGATEGTATFELDAKLDAEAEGPEEITVAGRAAAQGGAGGGAIVVTPAQAMITNTGHPDICTSTNHLVVTEGEDELFSLSMLADPPSPVEVTLEVADTSHLQISPKVMRFRKGKRTVLGHVTALHDADDQPNPFRIVATVTKGHIAGSESFVILGAIADDDRRCQLVFGYPNGRSVPEGGTLEYTAVLTSEPAADVPVEVSAWEPGHWEHDADVAVQGSPFRLTFTPDNWDTPQTLTLTAAEDDDAADGLARIIHQVTGTDDDCYHFMEDSLDGVVNGGHRTAAAKMTVWEADNDNGNAGPITPAQAPTPTTTAGDGEVTLEWNGIDGEVTGWQVSLGGGAPQSEGPQALAAHAPVDDGPRLWCDAGRETEGPDDDPEAGPAWCDLVVSTGDDERLSATVPSLENGTPYRFMIRAVNEAGPGVESDLTDAVTPRAEPEPPAAPPPAPKGLAATAGDAAVTLSWTDPADADITGYEYNVNHNATGTGNFTGWGPWTAISGSGAATVSHVIDGLANGREYRFHLRAVNAAGAGEAAPAADPWYVSATPVAAQAGTPPLAPTKPVLTVGDGEVDVAWISGGDGGSPITAWEITWEHDGSWGLWNVIPGSGPDTRSELETGLVNGDTYRFKVRAVNALGTGPASPASEAAVPGPRQAPAGPPLAPGKPTTVVGDAQLVVGWTSGGDGGSPITAWEITWERNGSWGHWNAIPGSGPDTRSETETGLVNGDTYRFKVRAVNALGTGPASPASDAVTPEAPPSLAVADTTAAEPGAGRTATLDFAVTLDRAAPHAVSVDYATHDGTAKAGSDYTAAKGTLTFARGETEKTIRVAVLDDSHDDGGETLTLTLSNARGARIERAVAIGTITNDDPIPKAWIGRFGRTVAGQMVDAITGRMEGGGASRVTIGGADLDFSGSAGPMRLPERRDVPLDPLGPGTDATETMTARDLLLGSAFQVAGGNEAAGRSFAAWGRAAAGGFDGTAGDVAVDGEVVTATLGADVEGEHWLAGLALSHSEGDGSYSPSGDADTAGGKVESTLTGVWPYARVVLGEGGSAWGMLGLGSGRLTVAPAGETPIETDLSMTMGAVGSRAVLAPAPEDGGFELALKADAFLVRTSSESAAGMKGAEADASRVRMLLDASLPGGLWDGTLVPRAEVGLRLDGGDTETGAGVEAGAALGYRNGRLAADASVRTLLAHQADGYEEWGASLSVGIDPDSDGRGTSFALSSSLGEAASGTEQLWSLSDAGGLAQDAGLESARQLDAEIGYGLSGPHGVGVVTPYAGVGLAGDSARSWRAGARWQLTPQTDLSLEGTLHDAVNDDSPGHELTLRARVRW